MPLVTFIKECRQSQGLISRSEEPEVAHMIKGRLRGRARAVPGSGKSTGITQLIDKLKEYFGQKYTLPECENSFLRKQKKREDTLDYVNKTRNLHDQTLEAAIDTNRPRNRRHRQQSCGSISLWIISQIRDMFRSEDYLLNNKYWAAIKAASELVMLESDNQLCRNNWRDRHRNRNYSRDRTNESNCTLKSSDDAVKKTILTHNDQESKWCRYYKMSAHEIEVSQARVTRKMRIRETHAPETNGRVSGGHIR